MLAESRDSVPGRRPQAAKHPGASFCATEKRGEKSDSFSRGKRTRPLPPVKPPFQATSCKRSSGTFATKFTSHLHLQLRTIAGEHSSPLRSSTPQFSQFYHTFHPISTTRIRFSTPLSTACGKPMWRKITRYSCTIPDKGNFSCENPCGILCNAFSTDCEFQKRNLPGSPPISPQTFLFHSTNFQGLHSCENSPLFRKVSTALMCRRSFANSMQNGDFHSFQPPYYDYYIFICLFCCVLQLRCFLIGYDLDCPSQVDSL